MLPASKTPPSPSSHPFSWPREPVFRNPFSTTNTGLVNGAPLVCGSHTCHPNLIPLRSASPAEARLSAGSLEGHPRPARSHSVSSPLCSEVRRGTALPGSLKSSKEKVTTPSTSQHTVYVHFGKSKAASRGGRGREGEKREREREEPHQVLSAGVFVKRNKSKEV